MSGNWGVVAIWVTHPLWPFRVPLTVICSVILVQKGFTYKGGWSWILSEGRVPLYLSHCGKRKRKEKTGSKTLEGDISSSWTVTTDSSSLLPPTVYIILLQVKLFLIKLLLLAHSLVNINVVILTNHFRHKCSFFSEILQSFLSVKNNWWCSSNL